MFKLFSKEEKVKTEIKQVNPIYKNNVIKAIYTVEGNLIKVQFKRIK